MAEPAFRNIAANGQTFHVAEAGPADGPLVFLLHGFPEFWFGWRRHIEGLAQAGFHVVAPDQRGYNLSSKPRGVGAYALDNLAADVVALGDALGAKQFTVVGHDWGASVGWQLATYHSERLRGLCALNAPHP
jgi:pimeloyl-ACP methyl ester carboxylesterase